MSREVSSLMLEYLISSVIRYSIDININTFGQEEFNEKSFYTIEQIAFDMGQRIMEKLLIIQRVFLVDTLDIFKFLCKDFWTLIFQKQIDNLKTNHKVIIKLLIY